MLRRTFLKALGASLFYTPLFGSSHKSIPILMFHKVVDTPAYPEDISPTQLKELFEYLFSNGFQSVNVSDILDAKVDSVVKSGFKPICITADDSHPSIFFSKTNHSTLENSKSFIEILAAATPNPRCSLFLSGIYDDRVLTTLGEYFGGYKSLKFIIKEAKSISEGIEFGYHTTTHIRMRDMDAVQTRELLNAQIEDFKQMGVYEDMVKILAYPYGIPPSTDGITELKNMGFKGAVIARPGNFEGKYNEVEECLYDKKLITDNFLIPRVNIGAFTYEKKGFKAINPIDDLKKDLPKNLYLC